MINVFLVELPENFFIDRPSFRIKKPSPFIKIPDQINDVNPHHFPVFVGTLFVVMNDAYIRIKYSPVFFVYSTRQVYVFGVHELYKILVF